MIDWRTKQWKRIPVCARAIWKISLGNNNKLFSFAKMTKTRGGGWNDIARDSACLSYAIRELMSAQKSIFIVTDTYYLG